MFHGTPCPGAATSRPRARVLCCGKAAEELDDLARPEENTCYIRSVRSPEEACLAGTTRGCRRDGRC